MQELLSSLPRLTEEDLVKLGHGGRLFSRFNVYLALHTMVVQAMTPPVQCALLHCQLSSQKKRWPKRWSPLRTRWRKWA